MTDRRGGCGAYHERPHHLEHRRDRRRVVGRAVADVVAGPHVAAAVTQVVVVRADHHVLVGEIGPRDDADDVGALIERLLVRIDAGGRRVRAVVRPVERFEEVILRGASTRACRCCDRRSRRPARFEASARTQPESATARTTTIAAVQYRRHSIPFPLRSGAGATAASCPRHLCTVARDATRARSEDRARSRGGLFSLVAACRPLWAPDGRTLLGGSNVRCDRCSRHRRERTSEPAVNEPRSVAELLSGAARRAALAVGQRPGGSMRTVVPARRRVEHDGAAVGVTVASTIDEAEAGAAAVARPRRVGAVEALERLRRDLGGHARARRRAPRARRARRPGATRAPRPACPRACARARCRRGWRPPGAGGPRRRPRCTRSVDRRGDRAVRVDGARVGTASSASTPRSTGARSSGRPWSSRARSSRSSTSAPMRTASCSVRRIASRELVGLVEPAACGTARRSRGSS